MSMLSSPNRGRCPYGPQILQISQKVVLDDFGYSGPVRRWEADVSHVARNSVEKRWTGCPKLKMIVLGRQKELIGPPQHGIIVDMMSYAYGNHWGTVGEPESFLS